MAFSIPNAENPENNDRLDEQWKTVEKYRSAAGAASIARLLCTLPLNWASPPVWLLKHQGIRLARTLLRAQAELGG